MKKLFTLCLYVTLTFLAVVRGASALSLDIAQYVIVSAETVSEGDIVSLGPNGFILSSTPYDVNVLGVVADNPDVSIRPSEDIASTASAILGSGLISVRVSAENGAIKRGDSITTSLTPGVGVKATEPGYIIGAAVEEFDGASGETGVIQMVFEPRHNELRPSLFGYVFDVFGITLSAGYEEPLTVFKYVLAALIVLLSVAAGFIYFGRIATKGIEALGRNPLASRAIQFGIVLNTIISVIIIASGVFVAVLILRL